MRRLFETGLKGGTRIMGAVKTIALPDEVFERVEKLRRRFRVSRAELIRRLVAFEEFDQLWREQDRKNKDLSEEEAMALANEVIRDVRKKRHRGRSS